MIDSDPGPPAPPPAPGAPAIPAQAGPSRRRGLWLAAGGCLFFLACCGLGGLSLWLIDRASDQERARRPADVVTPVAGRGPADAGQAARPGPLAGGNLLIPGGSPSTLDPALVRDVGSAAYMYEIYSGLVTLSTNLEVVGDLADRWDVSEDGRRYTFHLRPGLTFHDGSPLTSEALVYAIERACDPATGSLVAHVYLDDILGCREKLAGERDRVTGLSGPDDGTLVIDIDSPKAYFLAKLTYPTAFALDRRQVESDPDWASHPNGSGPFRLQEWTEEERIVLARHEGYQGAGPKAYLDRVEYDLRAISTETRYEAGELDAMPVGSGDIQRVQDPLNPLSAELILGQGDLGLSYMGFDTTAPPFDDAHVRRAMNLAVDKERLARVLLHGAAVPVWGLLPPDLPAFDPGNSPYRFDPEAARSELAASRYGGPAGVPPLTLFASGEGADPVIDAVVDSLRDVLDLDISVELASWELFEEEVTAGGYPFFTLGWSADYPDPQDFLDVLLHSGSALNHGRYANPEADAILEAARVEPAEERRNELYREAERLMLADAPWVPLFTGREAWLVAPYVQGFQLPSITLPRMQHVWLTTDAPER